MTAAVAAKQGGASGHSDQGGPLSAEDLRLLDAYWRAANYVSVGQIYLYGNPLLREKMTLAHVKPLLVGHWGTTPGQTLIYVHLNRAIKNYDLNILYIAGPGPGHGGPAVVGNVHWEGTWSEVYPVSVAARFRVSTLPPRRPSGCN